MNMQTSRRERADVVTSGPQWHDVDDGSLRDLQRIIPSTADRDAVVRYFGVRACGDAGPRPGLLCRGAHLFGQLELPRCDGERDKVIHREVDVFVSRDVLVTVRRCADGEVVPIDVLTAAIHGARSPHVSRPAWLTQAQA